MNMRQLLPTNSEIFANFAQENLIDRLKYTLFLEVESLFPFKRFLESSVSFFVFAAFTLLRQVKHESR
jgi:hypothetical protein